MVSAVVAYAGRVCTTVTLAHLWRSAWRRGVQRWARQRTRRLTEQALHALDAQGLRDLGLDASELSSVAAEVAGDVAATEPSLHEKRKNMSTVNLERRESIVATALATPMAPIAGDEFLKKNRELVTRYFEEAWNQGNLNVLDELIAGNYVNHSSSTPNPRPGPADLKPIVAEMRRGIPDLKYEILDMVVAPDKVAVYLRMTGTHSGTMFGMKPSGAKLDVKQMQFEWIEAGRIVQHWRLTDDLSLLRQMGQI